MGVKSTKWFEFYLQIENKKLMSIAQNLVFLTVTCGVPQGSILGPFFLLLYADDSTILFSHGNPDVISEKLGKELQSCNCSQWLIDNKLSLHLGKT